MKGLELPINMIIIIAIAVLVLVVIAAFFSGWFGRGAGTISVEEAFTKGCAALRSGYKCNPNEIHKINIIGYKERDTQVGCPTGGSGEDCYSLLEICAKKGFGSDRDACARACGCIV